MEKKLFAGFMLIVLLTSLLALMFNPRLIRASGTIVVPDDYPTIQEAIDAASPGDTVIVSEGTYPEGTIYVDKSLTILANGSVIVDGLQRGHVFFVYGWLGGITVKGFTITNSGRLFIDSGIFLLGPSNCRIEGNTIINSSVGIWVEDSRKSNMISNNVITNNDRWGIYLEKSSHVSIVNNTITKNNGEGFLLLYSNGNTISNNDLTAGPSRRNRLIYSNNNTISGNTITNNRYGIELEGSTYNSIVGNTIKNNYYGVYLEKSDGNSIHHNNFINNTNQAYIFASNNTWDSDYPSGGNYWSDYLGVDEKSGPYQNETGTDGIGDTPYTIDAYNQDRYPLMTAWEPLLGDINFDWIVNIYDIVKITTAYGSRSGDPNWNPFADIVPSWGIINIYDVVVATANYGKSR